MADWDHCKEGLKAVKDSFEIRSVNAMDQMRQRSWLMHWGLFVHLNQRDGFDALIDFMTERNYIQTTENITPWLMRYYVSAVILSPRRKFLIKDCLNSINNLSYLYTDPVLQFVQALYDQYDFDAAHLKLKECVVLMNNDFFLRPYVDKFLEESRILMCDVYCTIHRRVDMAVLAKILEVNEDQVEKWVVNMVRCSIGGFDSLIDSGV
jgi:translation initiation factor 3 subunit E